MYFLPKKVAKNIILKLNDKKVKLKRNSQKNKRKGSLNKRHRGC
jgi:hypothetical protein